MRKTEEMIKQKYANYFESLNKETANSCLVYLYKCDKKNGAIDASEANCKSYFDTVASVVCDNVGKFDLIVQIDRKELDPLKHSLEIADADIATSYDRHSMKAKNDNFYHEEISLRRLYAQSGRYNESWQHIGKVIQYAFPLEIEKKTGIGDIDLISYNKETDTVYLIEGKTSRNKDSLLRAAMEIETYSRILLTPDGKPNSYFEEAMGHVIPLTKPGLKFKKAILFFNFNQADQSEAQIQYKNADKYPNTMRLLKDMWGIEVFSITEEQPYSPSRKGVYVV